MDQTRSHKFALVSLSPASVAVTNALNVTQYVLSCMSDQKRLIRVELPSAFQQQSPEQAWPWPTNLSTRQPQSYIYKLSNTVELNQKQDLSKRIGNNWGSFYNMYRG